MVPGEVDPVVAGRLFPQGNILAFNYGQSYLTRENAIPIYDRELPLRPGILSPQAGLQMAGCIRDGSPDAWGRRVILNKISSRDGKKRNCHSLDQSPA